MNHSEFLRDRRVFLVGRFGGMSRREVAKVIRRSGGIVVGRLTATTQVIVVGEGETVSVESILENVDPETRTTIKVCPPEILTETQLRERSGIHTAEIGNSVTGVSADGDDAGAARDDAGDEGGSDDAAVESAIGDRLYTTAMLAELLRLPVPVVRQWVRCGLLVPVREVRRLAYFDGRELLTARRLAELFGAGLTNPQIRRLIRRLEPLVDENERPLEHLAIIVEGKRILLRRDDRLVEPGGQRRFDFDASDIAAEDVVLPVVVNHGEYGGSVGNVNLRNAYVPNEKFQDGEAENVSVKSCVFGRFGVVSDPNCDEDDGVDDEDTDGDGDEARMSGAVSGSTKSDVVMSSSVAATVKFSEIVALQSGGRWLMDDASRREDSGDFEGAIHTLRMAAAASGASPELSFRIAELLYRVGDLAGARERYFAVLEQDEDFVEARVNLGCVLAEEGKMELAIAALQGALQQHSGYADAHYQLARIYQQRYDEAMTAAERAKMPLFPEPTDLVADPVMEDDVGDDSPAVWGQPAKHHWTQFLRLAPSSPWADEAIARLAAMEQDRRSGVS